MQANSEACSAYVYYRMPHSRHFVKIVQKGDPQTFTSLDDVPLTGGYVVMPFVVTEASPILFIRPDRYEEIAVSTPQLPDGADGMQTDDRAERRAYARAFSAVKEMLSSGQLQKLVLSRRLDCTHLPPFRAEQLFLKACHYRPASFVALWHTAASGTWLVATPEPLLEKQRHGWSTVALAGTLPWVEGQAPAWNDKNREEQAIVVRFIEEQLRPVATDLHLSPTYSLRAGNIQHLCTDFRFHLRPEADLRALLSRLHPTPAVCGLPRPEARAAILRHEATPRRYYAGFSGPLCLNGETRLFVSLRCMQIGDDRATLYAGGGIMPGSVETEEWEETRGKLETMRALFQGAAKADGGAASPGLGVPKSRLDISNRGVEGTRNAIENSNIATAKSEAVIENPDTAIHKPEAAPEPPRPAAEAPKPLFCDIPQVNQLTALLLAHGIRQVVVCPGSRNATITHNLYAVRHLVSLTPVTDERSAAFVALGMTLASQEPTAVCVTSGSALLNCLPAVAEAYYRHQPLLVISADRPAAWIGQCDGQTLPQVGALAPYCPTHQLCTPHTETDRWLNNRRINEAILSLRSGGGSPAHINVPIEEPMFRFTTPALPAERAVRCVRPVATRPLPDWLVRQIAGARLPALVIGQYEAGDIRREVDDLAARHQVLLLSEILSDVRGNFRMNSFDACDATDADCLPDFVIQVGGNFVHKRFKQTLRRAACPVLRLGDDRSPTDTFCHLDTWVAVPPREALAQLAEVLPRGNARVRRAADILSRRWEEAERRDAAAPPLSTLATLRALRSALSAQTEPFTLHLANSSAVRAAGRVFEAGRFPIFCNRGVNGIEGSLSTAVGCALKLWGLHILAIGDLSFFYDANGLWVTQLPPTLRILLLNNGRGAIFDRLPGLATSPARDTYVAAGGGHYCAEGLAATFHLGYRAVTSASALAPALAAWLAPADRAQILEVFTTEPT